jgi:hypothetical protein
LDDDGFWRAPIAVLAFLSGARVAKQAVDDEKVGNAGMFGDGDVLPVLFDDEEAVAHDEEVSVRRKSDPSISAGPRFRREAVFDIGRPETWRAALPPRPKKLTPISHEWFLDDRGRPLSIMSDVSCPLGHVTDSGAEVADYEAAVRTGNGVRPGEVVRLGESVRTGVEPQRVPDKTESPGADAVVVTYRSATVPMMPGLAISWAPAPWVERFWAWAPKWEIARAADGLLSAPVADPVVVEAPAQIEDEWTHVIRNYAYGLDRVSIDQVGRHVVKKFGGQIDKKGQIRIGEIFTGMGWARFRTKSGRGFLNPDRHQLSQ